MLSSVLGCCLRGEVAGSHSVDLELEEMRYKYEVGLPR